MKKLISLLLALVMLLSLAACGQSVPEANDTPADAPIADATDAPEEKEPVVLSMWALGTVEGVDKVYQDWSDAVNAQYPWITIDYEPMTTDVLTEKLAVASATGTTPDLYLDAYSRIAPVVNAGLTMDLTDVYEANKDRFYSEERDGIVDGKNFYISYYTGAVYCMVVNMTLAEKLGVADMLPEDMETWSYEEFLNVCRAAKAADPSVIPTVLYAGSRSGDSWYYSWFLGNGAEITNEDLTAVAISDGVNKEKALEVMDVFATLIEEDLVPDGAASLIDSNAQDMFCAGNVLFFPTGYNKIAQMPQKIADGVCVEAEFDAVAIPTKEGKEAPRSVSFGSYGVVGFANNGNEEAVKLAIDVLLKNPELRKEEIKLRGQLSTMNDCIIEYATDDVTAIMALAADYSGRAAYSTFGILEPWWSDFRETFYVQLQDYYAGNIDAETMLANWQEAGTAVITAANNK